MYNICTNFSHMSLYFQFKMSVQDIVKADHEDSYLYKWFKGNILAVMVMTNLVYGYYQFR